MNIWHLSVAQSCLLRPGSTENAKHGWPASNPAKWFKAEGAGSGVIEQKESAGGFLPSQYSAGYTGRFSPAIENFDGDLATDSLVLSIGKMSGLGLHTLLPRSGTQLR